ncbi:sulfide dehydrogenase (flavoprotein) subunit SudA [Coriobacterium glomerans PW2]|uniref:Sulfide dehydrogenase (Flavoprotein) subunit SudA n=1 Tax=Coriobacterium glomerans (strain ATCC 49209 / DSM 20642 / JCM 10262 / PW2) TaxID=700015 RepID=F2N993_CORGP|nr:NADPH-dependent glutamate synthase [Coriobacterium glomerans]AEB07841.1 sulfide dehydrogenase (flavoprotein) subunit SudA [Coriobacterium glomerans PW2]
MPQEVKYRPNIGAPRVEPNEEPADARAKDFRPVDNGFTKAQAVAEANRCLDCKKPFCIDGCPVGVDIPRFLEAIRAEDWERGLEIIKSDNLLPSVCGRVCPQETQCEGKCILGRKGEPVAIGQLERVLGDMADEVGKAPECEPANGKKVAVVGSGPSGIACAGELARMGFEVTVFEAFFTGGGVLTYGIPEFRLPKAIVKREIEGLAQLGVKFEYDSVAGRLFDAEELFNDEGFDALYLAVGAGLPRFLHIPGENLPGVYCANEYLTRNNLMHAYDFPSYDTPIKHGRRVVVFGGGNVAMDAARTALRLGADEVTLAYRRTEKEMPARIAEIHHAKEEGVIFRELVSPKEFIADELGNLSRMLLDRMELGEPDASGRRRPIVIPDSEFEIECDVAITAIGTRANPFAKLCADIELDRWGLIEADEDGRTSNPKIWAGGDIVTGAATVILAMGAGKKAAASIKETLIGD